jgi:surface protein
MEMMFRRCYKLKSLNLENFDTSKVTTFYRMFESCDSLQILDFPNFNIKNAQNVEDAFDCENLEYFNLKILKKITT